MTPETGMTCKLSRETITCSTQPRQHKYVAVFECPRKSIFKPHGTSMERHEDDSSQVCAKLDKANKIESCNCCEMGFYKVIN
ncbi:hypothetical protein EXN66_Car002222 [Channa argus]|uniref:Uncharacterized protein n=1 Tax=Channa argus TaxID=215402 RepID=A0A6G1P8C4_CHAAH|nr:hypothetical protein EXN66_Car002222 [Channa argus]